MFDTSVVVVGNVLNQPEWRQLTDSQTLTCNFRVASHARRFDRESGRWVNGNEFRVRVVCWRRLAEGVASSIAVGDPVIVTGRLYTRDWTDSEGRPRTTFELEAVAVGHDLSRGRSHFARVKSFATAALAGSEADETVRGEQAPLVAEDEIPVSFGDGVPDADGGFVPLLGGGFEPFDTTLALPGTSPHPTDPDPTDPDADPDDDDDGELGDDDELTDAPAAPAEQSPSTPPSPAAAPASRHPAPDRPITAEAATAEAVAGEAAAAAGGTSAGAGGPVTDAATDRPAAEGAAPDADDAGAEGADGDAGAKPTAPRRARGRGARRQPVAA